MTKRTPLPALTTAALLLAVPATSHALGGGTDRQCYTHLVRSGQDPTTEQVTQPVNVLVNGGTPGSRFQVVATRANGAIAGSQSGTFDAAGGGGAQLTNLYPTGAAIGPLKGQKLTITVKDYGTNAEVTLGTVRLTNLAITAASKPRDPRQKRTVRVSGTPLAGKKKLFGFVTTKNGKQVLNRFKVGRPNGCGFAKRKVVVAPSPFRYGNFRLYVNPGKKLHRKRALQSRFRIYKTIL